MTNAGPSRPVQAFYCAICTLPTEYCEFGTSISKCRAWLEDEDKGEYDRLWGQGGFVSAILPLNRANWLGTVLMICQAD